MVKTLDGGHISMFAHKAVFYLNAGSVDFFSEDLEFALSSAQQLHRTDVYEDIERLLHLGTS